MRPPLVYDDAYDIPWPLKHPFPMAKFRLLRDIVVARGLLADADLVVPEPATDAQLGLAHTRDFIAALRDNAIEPRAWRATGLIWSEALVRRTITAVGGTLTACRLALEHGCAVNLAGGTHHAFADHGGGYCLLNDMAVAALTLVAEAAVDRVCIIDCDVHQGDGTAAICAAHPAVYTVSLHCGDNYPLRKQQSDLDVALPRNLDDDGYLRALRPAVETALQASDPDLVIYDAGVDPHRDDRLGHLSLTDAGLSARDATVLGLCRKRSIPIACVIGGGYDPSAAIVAERHAILPATAYAAFS
jgi:acetoin utilization deacetylase AcuC-like enzyme